MRALRPPSCSYLMSLRISATSDEIRDRFSELKNENDLAALLEITVPQLRRYSYGRGRRYSTFFVRKRRGGRRELCIPGDGLKVIQQKLVQVFTAVYRPHNSVHGFVTQRSVATNAQMHERQSWVLNVDLEDFFPSINFGRVRGLLMAKPYGLPANIATIVAQLCCRNRQLPQGAPTSPIVSNMICAQLDSQLSLLARRYKSIYTRYADDITFSRSSVIFPASLAARDVSASPPITILGPILQATIEANGFKVNPLKIRLQSTHERQEVTGLKTNTRVNVSREFTHRIRAMIHAWRKFGYDAASFQHFDRYDKKSRAPHRNPQFSRIVKGHIDYLAMIRGNDDRLVLRFLAEYAELSDTQMRPPEFRRPNHLVSYKDAIWVIECTRPFMSQGTAFELDSVGFVTSAHVVLDDFGFATARDLMAYQPRAPERQFPVRVEDWDYANDLAILSFPFSSRMKLTPKFAPRLMPGEQVHYAGFPNYDRGSTIFEGFGQVVGMKQKILSPRYAVTCPIVKGASGSPVFDRLYKVIGVASEGAETFDRAITGIDVQFGAIPIDVLLRLHQRNLDRHSGIAVAPRGSAFP